jgi:rhamnulokinase
MKTSRYLAFDLGAESGRALIGDFQDDRLLFNELGRFPNGTITVRDHLHWNIFNLFENIKEGLKTYTKQSDRPPQSVGIDTWGVDFALLAGDGSILGLPYGYRDRRTEGAMESFFEKIPRDRVYELTGIQFLPLNTLFQLESMVRDGSPLLTIATDLLFMPDLMHYLLTGIKITEFSFATTSQLYNPVKGDWEDELFSALDLPKTLMQPIVMPGQVIGETSQRLVDETDFPSTPVVAVATHDTGSAVAAVPAEGQDWAYISSGTWSLMGVESDRPLLTEQVRDFNFTNEGGVDGSFRVLKNIAGLWLVQQCRASWTKAMHDQGPGYGDLTDMARASAPFVSLVDPDDPAFLTPPDMPAAIRDYCVRTGQPVPESRGAMIRCILESLALKSRFVLDQLRLIHPHRINRIHLIGGGVKNPLLCQFTADACGLPLLAGPMEATAIGNLLVQAMAVNQISSVGHLRQVVRNSVPIENYKPRNQRMWESAYRRFLDLEPI